MEEAEKPKKKQYIDPVPKEDREIANQIIDAFYKAAPEKVTMPDGSEIEVPDSGSLSLLAMGHTGLFAWRKSREKKYGDRIISPMAERVKQVLKDRKKAIEEKKKAETEKGKNDEIS